MTLLAPTGLEALTPKLPPKPRDLGLNVGGGAQSCGLEGEGQTADLCRFWGHGEGLAMLKKILSYPQPLRLLFRF